MVGFGSGGRGVEIEWEWWKGLLVEVGSGVKGAFIYKEGAYGGLPALGIGYFAIGHFKFARRDVRCFFAGTEFAAEFYMKNWMHVVQDWCFRCFG